MEARIFSVKKLKYELYFGKLEIDNNFELQRILNKWKNSKTAKKRMKYSFEIIFKHKKQIKWTTFLLLYIKH